MALYQTPGIVAYLFLTGAIALLVFFTYISITMIISLQRQREMRRRKKSRNRPAVSQYMEERFRQDMGRER